MMSSKQLFSLFLVVLVVSVASSTYVPTVSLEMAYMSNIAYENQSSIDAWTCADCSRYQIQNQDSFYSAAQDQLGFTGYLPQLNAIVISFRGTASADNVGTDLNGIQVAPKGYPNCVSCKVHDGFLDAYKSVRPFVTSNLQNLMNLHKKASVYITGHSLGGAVAVLAAVDLNQMGIPIQAIYTFGQPRVGNSNFADYLNSKFPQLHRVIDNSDPIPHNPPSSLGYVHGG